MNFKTIFLSKSLKFQLKEVLGQRSNMHWQDITNGS